MKIFYDGDCYFCTNFVKLLKLREAVGIVELVSLRDDTEDVRRILALGLNVNLGFVVEHEGHILHGAHAFHYLNTLTEPRNILSQMVYRIGVYPRVSRALYPALVVGRYVVLIAQGRSLIDRNPAAAGGNPSTDTSGARIIRLCAILLLLATVARLIILSVYPVSMWTASITSLMATVSLAIWLHLFIKGSRAHVLYKLIRNADWQTVGLYVLAWFCVVNSFDLVPFRRFAGFVAILPIAVVAYSLFAEHKNNPLVGKVPAAAPLALLLFAFFPGLYLAPFYGGIFGWTSEVDRSKPVVVSGFKLVNSTGREIWYNHAFLQPMTMNTRFARAFANAIPEPEKYAKFMFENYERIYPTLRSGRMPHEWALGRLAYPSHNLSDSNATDYVGEFEPTNIVGIVSVVEAYSFDGKLLSSRRGPLMPVVAE